MNIHYQTYPSNDFSHLVHEASVTYIASNKESASIFYREKADSLDVPEEFMFRSLPRIYEIMMQVEDS